MSPSLATVSELSTGSALISDNVRDTLESVMWADSVGGGFFADIVQKNDGYICTPDSLVVAPDPDWTDEGDFGPEYVEWLVETARPLRAAAENAIAALLPKIAPSEEISAFSVFVNDNGTVTVYFYGPGRAADAEEARQMSSAWLGE